MLCVLAGSSPVAPESSGSQYTASKSSADFLSFFGPEHLRGVCVSVRAAAPVVKHLSAAIEASMLDSLRAI